ncbi:hypothetical protein [Streptomyces melanogenes]|uniref:Uncharacterized protein n=1 Tax=Streptomyces melanogenes TaxID=67326 RepID=A0ABZ1XUX2_9ACTN|nr:hypothetical protein [Streptomyces melanogenes]
MITQAGGGIRVGGSFGWQTGPYQQDLGAAFRQAQEQELAKDDHGFPERTLDQLWEDEGWQEYIFTGGTGSVLDLVDVVEPTDAGAGPFVRPLTDREVRAWAPTGQPSYADWADAMDSEALRFPARGCGNCTVLYDDGQPAQIGYWGVTAD